MIDVIKRILAAAKAANLRAGIHCGTPEYAARAIGWGFDLTTVSGDSRLLAAAASSSLHQVRSLIEANAGGADGRPQDGSASDEPSAGRGY